MSITSKNSSGEEEIRNSFIEINRTTDPWSIINQTTSDEMRLKLAKDGFVNIIQNQGTTGIHDYFEQMEKEGLIKYFEYKVATHIHIVFEEYTGKIGEIGL